MNASLMNLVLLVDSLLVVFLRRSSKPPGLTQTLLAVDMFGYTIIDELEMADAAHDFLGSDSSR